MEITKTLQVADRGAWREWLRENHATEPEIWLVYAKKASNKPRIPYDDAVEEALCFGWIDGIAKTLDEASSAQRFTPRRAKSNWSELNKERARRLIAAGQMTPAGLAVLPDLSTDAFAVPADIEAALKAEAPAWENFQQFPESYRRIRVGFIQEARKRPDLFQQRLAYFVKKTAANKRFGTMP